MRILILVSSYRKHGNTARLVELISAEMQAEAERLGETLELETLHMAHMDIQPCRGCRACFDRGEAKCPVRDDIPVIKRKIESADGLLLASPVYVEDVNGVMKTWIDRMAYVCHRPDFAGKCIYLVVTSGTTATRHSLDTMSLAMRTWGGYLCGQASFKMGALMPLEEIKSRFQDQASRIARMLLESTRRNKALDPSILSLMIFQVQKGVWGKAADGSFDYNYWKEKGWLEPGTKFYIPIRSSQLKIWLAQGLGALVGLFYR
ncbi:MAG TPA: flavodoxin family protein [Anaerolineaceae bacterium]